MTVHCRKHTNFCTNKMWKGRIMPVVEAYYINEEDKIELADFENWHRSQQGIEGFLTQHGLIEDKMDPEALLSRAGKKMLELS